MWNSPSPLVRVAAPRGAEVLAAVEVTSGVGGRRRAMQVAAVSTPQDAACWRWRIVNYAGEIVEESRETYTTIGRAIEEGSKRLTKLNAVDNSVPFYPHRSTRHLQVP